MLVRLSLTILIIFMLSSSDAFSEVSGSTIEIYKKNGETAKGELIEVDSNIIQILVRLPKTSKSIANYETKEIVVNLCDSATIEGAFTGASPYLLSGVLGVGSAAITIGSADSPNYYVGGAIGALVGVFSYLFIDKSLSRPEIRLTEIDKYPWKLKPYSRNYKSN
jgi:hypothetical protein